MLEKADPELEADLGKEHPLGVLYGLNRAALLHRSGRVSEAAALIDGALPKLRTAFGASAPTVARLEALRNDRPRASRTNSASARFADMFL
jgi:hypothetical protein